ncbi:hypothetical protein TVAG_256640 [Trichomonas vaginalis G3]|uniref:Autophagy-related protein 13 N-terminal domain-containing protein n=1 Tax=Trichomonas vaginalis (strain ATCC PRA-98 / G3) TaxID=412133 RepID=A2FEX0_TRIV3|nr:HORMA domain domain-containing protein [Trichomonas vaginalis G3]EAX96524.1 hypothetical protein TVAG_256640 [Trichomonas vaginalis G3]KAI5541108.1 HORMA domain domain-containing protein [Trichomonas vaginalis G3]|eukprot:XP_001309454.1 hypothetical protein [Trichomonas vaginalis G3]
MSSEKTQILGKTELQKIISLTREFLNKVIECIYYSRCPGEIADFREDDFQFSLKIPRSQSLRQLTSSHKIHGFVKLDIIIVNPDKLLERWIIEHRPLSKQESEVFTQHYSTEEKHLIYQKFSSCLRSVFCILNALPAQSIALNLKNYTAQDRKISALCGDFKMLEDQRFSLDEGHTKQVALPPVLTPVGKTIIRCQYLKEPEKELVPIINITKGTSSSSSTSDSVQPLQVEEPSSTSPASYEWYGYDPNVPVDYGSYVTSPMETEFISPDEN